MRRSALIVLCGLVLAGCGGEKTVSPTGKVEGTLPQAAKADPTAGKKLFSDNGCNGCHTLKAAGSAGTIGPDLDKTLKGKDAEFVKTSIVDPSAVIEKGYADAMPKTYGQDLSSKQIADLVAFLTPK